MILVGDDQCIVQKMLAYNYSNLGDRKIGDTQMEGRWEEESNFDTWNIFVAISN